MEVRHSAITAPSRAGLRLMQDHLPVMLDQTLAGLAPRAGGIYVDATFGRGGHSAAILQSIGDSGFLHALDRDPEACAAARERFSGFANFQIHRQNFSDLADFTQQHNLSGQVSGLLLDLGVSSPQFDDATRGFSFSNDGPLDMRMDPDSGESAAQWIARADETEIADVLWTFGEERASRRIARRIVQVRTETPLLRTAQLADLISGAMRGPRQKIHPATRSFQAIRIFINRELEALQKALQASLELLATGGRLAVISFHSLEDRLVKRFMRSGGAEGDGDVPTPANPYAATSRGERPAAFRTIGRYFATEQERSENPRARSAVLRVAERLA